MKDRLVKRFFDIMDNGGKYIELFAIRDLMISEYINGHRHLLDVYQIDSIIEENVMPEIEEYLGGAFEYEIDKMKELEEKAYRVIYNINNANKEEELDRAFELVNKYGDLRYNNPYIYYCLVKGLERVTGENYIEICL